jgi:hypothetical protein
MTPFVNRVWIDVTAVAFNSSEPRVDASRGGATGRLWRGWRLRINVHFPIGHTQCISARSSAGCHDDAELVRNERYVVYRIGWMEWCEVAVRQRDFATADQRSDVLDIVYRA